MLLALDVGNTNIKTALFESGSLKNSWRLAVDKHRTADEYGVQMESFFHHLHISTNAVDGIILSSVVPSINYTIEHMCSIYFNGIRPMQVDASLQTGLTLCYDHPATLGSDRICNAVAAYTLYGGPCITIDFGTATTFGVLSAQKEFLGGVICPGFKVSTNALIDNTAMLPKVAYVKPKHIIGHNTEHCIQSGILYGYVGQVEHVVAKIQQELGTKARVVATGGMSELISSETTCIDAINPTLTLEGLRMLYEMNC